MRAHHYCLIWISIHLSAISLSPLARAQAPAKAHKLRFADPFNIGGSFLSATQRQKTISAKNRMLYLPSPTATGWAYHRTTLDLSSMYDSKWSDTSAVNITRRLNLQLDYLRSITKSNQGFITGKGELYHNNALGMRLQQSYGAGGGYDFQKRAPRNGIDQVLSDLELTADLRLVDQNFTKQARQRFAAVLLHQKFTQDLGSLCKTDAAPASPCPRFQFISSFTTMLPIKASDAWQLRGLAELILPFHARFAMRLTTFGDYFRNAPPPFRKSYLVSTIGLDIKYP